MTNHIMFTCRSNKRLACVRNAQPSRDQHNQAPSNKWLALREHLLDRLQGHLLLRGQVFLHSRDRDERHNHTFRLLRSPHRRRPRRALRRLLRIRRRRRARAWLACDGRVVCDRQQPRAATTSVSALLSHNATASTNSSKSASVKNLYHISLRHGASGLNAKASM